MVPKLLVGILLEDKETSKAGQYHGFASPGKLWIKSVLKASLSLDFFQVLVELPFIPKASLG